MEKTVSKLSLIALALLFTACGQSTPSVKDNTNKCAKIERDLLKVERFTQKVESMSAFHLEEFATAIKYPQITTSNNKREMLKDAAKRKTELETEFSTLSCEVTE